MIFLKDNAMLRAEFFGVRQPSEQLAWPSQTGNFPRIQTMKSA